MIRFLIIIETLFLNENVFVSSKNSNKYQNKNEHLSKELDLRSLRHLETNSTNDVQNNSDFKEENKVVQTVENANKTQESVSSPGFLKEDVKNPNVDNLKENKTSENKEVSDNNSATGKGSEEDKNQTIDANKTQVLITNATSVGNKDNDDQKEEKGESLKVNLKESNKTQSKGSNSDLKDNQNAAPEIEEKKDNNISENKSDIESKNDVTKVKTEIESLKEAYNHTKKSHDAPKKEENNNGINTSKTNKDSTPIAYNKTDKSGSNKNDSNKPNEEYNDEWKEEDSIAHNAFAITICFFIIFIVLFFYNLIKCYRKNTPQEKPIDTTQYSRELQSQTLDEDAVLDLTTN